MQKGWGAEEEGAYFIEFEILQTRYLKKLIKSSFFHFPRFSYFTISSFFPFSLLLKSISGNKIQYINYKNKQYNLWQGLKLLLSWKSPNHPIKLGRCKNKVSITIKQLNTNFYTNLLNRTIGNHIWIFRNEIYQESIMLVDQYSSKNNDL